MSPQTRLLLESSKSLQLEAQFHPDAQDYPTTLKRLQAELLEREEEVEALEKALHQARERCLQAVNALTEFQYVHSALSRLPNELLGKLFQQCVWNDYGNNAVALCRWAMPRVLVQVCRRWRAVVISTKSLWNIIRIDVDQDLRAHRVQEPWLMINEYFMRSDPLPVSCQLRLGRHYDVRLQRQLIEGILEYAPRLRDISIEFDKREDLFELWITNMTEVPLLETLHLEVFSQFRHRGSNVEQLPAPISWGLATNAPNLIEAVIQAPSYYSFPITVLPWTNLKELECSFHSLEEMCDIAQQLTNLEYWYIGFYWNSMEPTQQALTATPITIPKLRLLETNGVPALVPKILDRLRTPALEDLGLIRESRDIDSSTEAESILSAISRLQNRSQSSIRRLSCPLALPMSHSSRDHHNLDSVEELSMFFPTYGVERDSHFVSLNVLTDPNHFPNIKTLHLDFQVRSPEDIECELFDSFLCMVEARSRYGSEVRLERMSFSANDQASPDIPLSLEQQRRLRGLERDGVVLLGRIMDHYWRPSYQKEVGWNCEVSRLQRREVRYNMYD